MDSVGRGFEKGSSDKKNDGDEEVLKYKGLTDPITGVPITKEEWEARKEDIEFREQK